MGWAIIYVLLFLVGVTIGLMLVSFGVVHS